MVDAGWPVRRSSELLLRAQLLICDQQEEEEEEQHAGEEDEEGEGEQEEHETSHKSPRCVDMRRAKWQLRAGMMSLLPSGCRGDEAGVGGVTLPGDRSSRTTERTADCVYKSPAPESNPIHSIPFQQADPLFVLPPRRPSTKAPISIATNGS